ncbi:Uncharacterised protein [Mycobacteroides abscessus]|nr:Uncharacterised protein [Mycobacteroides abscessus]
MPNAPAITEPAATTVRPNSVNRAFAASNSAVMTGRAPHIASLIPPPRAVSASSNRPDQEISSAASSPLRYRLCSAATAPTTRTPTLAKAAARRRAHPPPQATCQDRQTATSAPPQRTGPDHGSRSPLSAVQLISHSPTHRLRQPPQSPQGRDTTPRHRGVSTQAANIQQCRGVAARVAPTARSRASSWRTSVALDRPALCPNSPLAKPSSG